MDRISKSELGQIGESLAGLPEKEPDAFSRTEAVRRLMPMIQTALEKGYSHEDVVKMLAERHAVFMGMSAAALRSTLLRSAKRKPPAKLTRQSKVAKPDPFPTQNPIPDRAGSASADAGTTNTRRAAPTAADAAAPINQRRHAGLNEEI